jgi:hypothetical protein
MQPVIRMDVLPVKRHAKKTFAFHSAFHSIIHSALHSTFKAALHSTLKSIFKSIFTTIQKSDEQLRRRRVTEIEFIKTVAN